MNLQEKLRRLKSDFESGETPAEIIETLNTHVERLILQRVEDNALAVGQKAPLDMEVITRTGTCKLKEFLTDRFLILTWFRGNW